MHRTSNLAVVAAMLAGTGAFVVGDSFMKLVTNDLPPFEVLFLRGVAWRGVAWRGVAWRGVAWRGGRPRLRPSAGRARRRARRSRRPCILVLSCGRLERR